MEKRDVGRYLLVWLILAGLIGFLIIFGNKFTGFAVFEDISETNFSQGTYVNTTYNGSAVVLSGSNLSGTYISQIFDAGNDAVWNNISWVSGTPNLNSLFCVDGGGDVYKSVDSGVTWSMSKEDYGRTSDGAYMFSDGSYIYIISNSNREIWRSSDGESWSIVNDSFADSGLLVGEADSTDNLFVADASGDVYISSDNGVTWTLQGDFNAGASNNPKGIGINSSDDIYIVDGVGDVYSSTDSGVNWVKVNDGYGGGTGTDDLKVLGSNVYILLNKDIYESTDGGVSWNLINDSFTSYSNDGLRMAEDGVNLYIADGSGRFWKSTDFGISWLEVGDCNNAASNNPKGIANFVQQTSLDIQVKSCNDAACSGESWTDVTDTSPQNLSLDNNRYFQYKIGFTSPDTSITSSLESVNINYDLVNTAPVLNLIHPQDGASYGYNESLSLNFSVSDSENNIDSCWYNINTGDNITLAGCANTTIDVPEGSNTLIIYANDTQGEETSDSASFSVDVGAPTIVLHFPINVYFNSGNNIQFNYTPTDIDLGSCELWGDFTGSFMLNQTDNSPTSGSVNTFTLNLSEGAYLWNIKCNDSIGNSATNGNKTFYVDTINPSLSLTEPTGSKTSRTITASWSVSDASPISCLYNVYQGASLEITNTSVDCSLNTTSFDVSADADFIFNFYVNDSAGNSNSTSLNFSVDTSTPPSSPSSSGSSSGGGGGGGIITPKNQTGKLEVSKIGNIISREGEKKTFSLSVENIGRIFLNNCKLVVGGDIISWIYSTQVEGVAPGQNIDFVFDLSVPEGVESGDYTGTVEVKCDEGNNVQDIVVSIPSLKIISIKDIKQEEKTLKIIYDFDNSNVVGDSVSVDIWLEDSDGYEITRISDVFSINKEGPIERNIDIKLKNPAGIYYVYLALSDDLDNFIKKSVVLGDTRATGQVVLDTFKGKFTIYIIFVILIVIVVFFIWRRHGKTEDKKHHWLVRKKEKRK